MFTSCCNAGENATVLLRMQEASSMASTVNNKLEMNDDLNGKPFSRFNLGKNKRL